MARIKIVGCGVQFGKMADGVRLNKTGGTVKVLIHSARGVGSCSR